MQGNLGIERMCQLAAVSRAGFYRSLSEQRPVEDCLNFGVHSSRPRVRATITRVG
jgi:hypothetical protein